MDKEKEIEEIAKIVCDICFSAPHGIPCPEGLEKVCSFAKGEFANSIANIIESKAEEVRKETAKEILTYIYRLAQNGEHLGVGGTKHFAKTRYGVEVDE